jgi:predicted acyltransferase (DUF342 family)
MPPFRSDPLDELVIPDGTHVEEHDLVTEGDVVVGGQSVIEFGVRGRAVVAGERVRFGGHIEAEGDCRLDMWCEVADNVLVGEDAYLGERVNIGGELKVAGDLDIGDDVDIEDGFEANGWIVIRNPMPTIVFLFVYLGQLLRIGEEEAAEEVLAAMLDDDGDREHQPAIIPRGARVGDDAWRVSTPARIGDGCRLHGNVRAESLTVGRDNEIFGGLRAKEGITLGAGTEVAGNVTTRTGTVRIGPDTHVRGDVAGEHVEVHREADIDGSIRAREETTMVTEPVLEEPAVVSLDAVDETAEGSGQAATGPEPDNTASETAAIDGDSADTGGATDETAVDNDQSPATEVAGDGT